METKSILGYLLAQILGYLLDPGLVNAFECKPLKIFSFQESFSVMSLLSESLIFLFFNLTSVKEINPKAEGSSVQGNIWNKKSRLSISLCFQRKQGPPNQQGTMHIWAHRHWGSMCRQTRVCSRWGPKTERCAHMPPSWMQKQSLVANNCLQIQI